MFGEMPEWVTATKRPDVSGGTVQALSRWWWQVAFQGCTLGIA